MKPLEDYQREFAQLTAGEAIDLLTEFKSLQEGVLIQDTETRRLVRTTPMQLCFKVPGETLASKVGPFQFCGGPPGRFLWVGGTLQTMVIDKVMHFDAEEELLRAEYGIKIAPGC
jgi:hypothetical protein